MARPGITYSEVAKAATQLTAQNTRPSIEAVRRILGTGSNSTISRHLRDWQQKQGATAELEQGLPESLLIAMRGVYDAMQEQANNQLDNAKSDHQAVVEKFNSQINQVTAELAEMTENINSLQTRFNESEHAKTDLQDKLANLTQENQQLTLENRTLNEQLNIKNNESQRLNELLLKSQANLEHYRESVRQERQQEKQTYEETLSKYSQENMALLRDLAQAESTNKQMEHSSSQWDNKEKSYMQELSRQKDKIQKITVDNKVLSQNYRKVLADHETLTAKKLALENLVHGQQVEVSRYQEKIEQQASFIKKFDVLITKLSNPLVTPLNYSACKDSQMKHEGAT